MKRYLFFLLLFLGSLQGFSQKRTYEYDDLNRLSKVSVYNGSTLTHTITYNYDEMGNRLSKATTVPCVNATATLTGTQTINIGQSANLSVAFTGDAPYNFVVNGQSYNNITVNPYTFSVMPNTTTTYNLSSLTNACGAGTVSGSAVVSINGVGNCPPTVTHSGNIASNTYRTSQNIISTANVPNNTKYYAGQSIVLQAGFSAGPNENFEAIIQGCVPINGLVSQYLLNGNSSDALGSNAGTISGNVIPSINRAGLSGNAMKFGGVSNVGVISVSNSSSLQFSAGFSISIWYKIPSYYGMDGYGQPATNGYQVMMGKEGDRSGFYIGVSNNTTTNKQRLNFTNNVNSTNNFDVSTELSGTANDNLNKWIHLVVVASSTQAKIYTDGVLRNTANVASINYAGMNSQNLYIGTMRALNSYWYPFGGDLDDIRIYNRTLSDAEILQIYNAEKP